MSAEDIAYRSVPFRDESMLGFVHRTLWSNGYSGLSSLSRSARAGVHRGFLSDIQSMTVGNVVQNDFRSCSGLPNSLELYDPERYTVELHLPEILRFCPKCLKERAYYRDCWSFSIFIYCHHHSSILIDHCPTCHKRYNWSKIRGWRCQCGTRIDSLSPERLRNTQAEKYLTTLSQDVASGMLVKSEMKQVLDLFAQLIRPSSIIPAFLDFSQLTVDHILSVLALIGENAHMEETGEEKVSILDDHLEQKSEILRNHPLQYPDFVKAGTLIDSLILPLCVANTRSTPKQAIALQTKTRYLDPKYDGSGKDVAPSVLGMRVKASHLARILDLQDSDICSLVREHLITPMNPEISLQNDWIFDFASVVRDMSVFQKKPLLENVDSSISISELRELGLLIRYNTRIVDIINWERDGRIRLVETNDSITGARVDKSLILSLIQRKFVDPRYSFPSFNAAAALSLDIGALRAVLKSGYLSQTEEKKSNEKGIDITYASLRGFSEYFTTHIAVAAHNKIDGRTLVSRMKKYELPVHESVRHVGRPVHIIPRLPSFEQVYRDHIPESPHETKAFPPDPFRETEAALGYLSPRGENWESMHTEELHRIRKHFEGIIEESLY